MLARSYSEVRDNLKACMDEVETSHAPMLITRRNGGHAVLVSHEDWASLEETLYLLGSRANAERIFDAMKQADAGQLVERDLLE